MKKIMHKMKKCRVFMVFLLAFTMIFGIISNVQAEGDASDNIGSVVEVYDPDAKGSITVALPDLMEATSKEGVQVNIYKVGKLSTVHGYFDFSLDGDFTEVQGVDLNNISTASDNESMAQTFVKEVKEQKIDALESKWTDTNGEVTFDNLEQGMYMISQGKTNAYGRFNAFMMPVPYAKETGWVYHITITPKAMPVTTMGRIEVTKKIKGLNAGDLQDVHAKNATYYIGLFLDADGTQPYRGENAVKPVYIIDGNSGMISFDNIPISDQPYYIFETTQDGRPIQYMKQQGGENDFYCMAGEVLGAEGYNTAPVIVMEDQADGVGKAVISNVYSDLPEGYYYTGEITITKSIMDDGNMIASEDVFYAGIFTVDEQGNVSENPIKVVQLKNNASVTVEVPLGGSDGTQPITYAVKETDEKGVPVSQDSGFLYQVTGEGNVNLSLDQITGTIHITNTLGATDGYYRDEPSTEKPKTKDSGSSSNKDSSSGSNRSSGSTKTGDDNPIMLYVGILAVAIVLGGVVVVRRRKRSE